MTQTQEIDYSDKKNKLDFYRIYSLERAEGE